MRVSAWNNGRHRFFNYSACDSSAVQSKTDVIFINVTRQLFVLLYTCIINTRLTSGIINNNLGYYGLYVYIHMFRR